MDEKSKAPGAKKWTSVLVVLLLFGLGGYLFYLVQSGRLAAGNPVCSVCQRPLHLAETYRIVSNDGKEHLCCCPRCGLRFAIENKAKAVSATDFSNGQRIDAESAYYLEGSDTTACCNSSTMRTNDGIICEMHYDRCMPSLLAFARKDAAEGFQRQHGGRIISFRSAFESVLQQLTH